MFFKKLLHRPAALVMHLALLLIIAGALATSFSARKGMLHLRVGDVASSYVDSKAGETPLPFSFRLDDFSVRYYPGTETPSDYRSEVSLLTGDGAILEQSQVSMNRILSCRGYRFYQSSYDNDSLGSTFTVSRDPWGIGLVYSGYALFLLGFFIFFFTDRKFKSLGRKVTGIAAALVLLFSVGVPEAGAKNSAPKTLPKDVAEELGELYVSYHGRVCPLQSVAKDFKTKLYGLGDVSGLSDEQVLAGWMFYPSSWRDVPQKERKSKGDGPAREETVRALLGGELLKLYPVADSLGHIGWYSQSDRLPESLTYEEWLFIRKGMDYVGEMVIGGDWNGVSATIGKIRKFQIQQAGDCLPSPARILAERLYNSFPPLFPIAGIFLVVGLVLALWCISYFIKGGEIDVRVRLAALVLDGVLLAFLTLMLALLWIASGHVPLSNGAETMMAIAWTVLLGGVVAGWKFRLLPPYALIVASLALMVAAMGQANPAVTLLAPVLSSPLLSIHVSLMMLSYAILALIMINSASALGVYAVSKGKKMDVVSRLADVSMLRLYFGVFFLAAGIITGSVWANVSWGCYWNWDPKETWALITLLIYAIAVHRSDIEALRNPVVFHIFLLLAFISVLFTYFGVNYLLGGMHSYAG